ncbi:MAG: aldo/keto reductase, partial [Pseudomonadota bacterium]|nr:aldo/keto reductase [Pseudomonadota bacterium]
MPAHDTSQAFSLPRIGLGTWRMGEDASRRGAEVAAVREALA